MADSLTMAGLMDSNAYVSDALQKHPDALAAAPKVKVKRAGSKRARDPQTGAERSLSGIACT